MKMTYIIDTNNVSKFENHITDLINQAVKEPNLVVMDNDNVSKVTLDYKYTFSNLSQVVAEFLEDIETNLHPYRQVEENQHTYWEECGRPC